MNGNLLTIVGFVAGFGVIALAGRQIGDFFERIKLPRISGFLFTGIVAGPFVLKLIPAGATLNLRFIDEVSLAVIAFSAGNELYLRELKSRFKSIQRVTAGLVTTTFTVGSLAVFALADIVPFMRTMPASSRVAVAILAGAILVARSPSSAIAVINELRARGPFTKTALGVTVIMDVAVITLFAVCSSVADALLTGLHVNVKFVALLVTELIVSLAAGYGLAKILQFVLSRSMKRVLKTGLVLLAGYGVFAGSSVVRGVTQAHLPFEVLLEPLLICMIGSFLTTNFSPYRTELLKILHSVAPTVYVLFFTLTGASLALDVLAQAWLVALVLFAVRIAAIFIGSFTGGVLAGDPMRFNGIGWMAYITQAGVGLGLAKEVAVEFPDWGAAFATIIIAIIVINQIVGPPLFKWAIHLAGEARPRAESAASEAIRDAVIFGLEGQSLALARLLRSRDWEVKIASRQADYVAEMGDASDIEICPIPDLSARTLKKIGAAQADTIVTMLSDEENYRICEIAYEQFGTQNLIVRLNARTNVKRFQELGALVVDPNTAIVSLLEQFVRSPSTASLLLGLEKNKDVIDFELRNPDLQGIPIRDLRLPPDVLLLSVRRRGQMLMSVGYTRLEVGDWVTVMGSVSSLEKMMLRFGVNREDELLHLVESVAPAELSDRSLGSDVKEIIREEKTARDDRFEQLIEESIILDLPAAIDRDAFFELAGTAMARRLPLPADELFDLLMTREKEASTAITPFLAIPHIIIPGQSTFSILMVRCKDGIHFSELAPRVQAVFVLAGTRDERGYHLRALSSIAEIVQNPQFEKRWLRARNETALRNAVLM